jgi:hypothetical protein
MDIGHRSSCIAGCPICPFLEWGQCPDSACDTKPRQQQLISCGAAEQQRKSPGARIHVCQQWLALLPAAMPAHARTRIVNCE